MTESLVRMRWYSEVRGLPSNSFNAARTGGDRYFFEVDYKGSWTEAKPD